MDSSRILYRTPAQTQQDHVFRYRFGPTADLLAEEEYLRWQIAELMTDLEQDRQLWQFPQESLDYLLVALRDVQTEIAQRERLRHHPVAPDWPERNEQRYQRFKDLAARLKSVVSLEQFCQHELGIQFRPTGKNLRGRCPFPDHEDRHPSFSISPMKQVWTCTCRTGGDLFVLVAQLHGLDRFEDQVLHVADVASLTGEVPHAG